MLRTLIVAAAALACVSAAADVRVFVTSSASGYGLNEPANAFIPTFSTVDVAGNNVNAYDFYHSNLGPAPNGQGFSVSNFPPVDAPSGTVENPILIDVSAGEWAYIWFQFRDEPYQAYVNGLEVVGTPAGVPPGHVNQTPELEYTHYLQNDLGGDPSKKRWDGRATAPGYPEWHHNPQTLVSITAAGISNRGDDPQMLFENQTSSGSLRTGVALLGAIRGPATDRTYEYQIVNFGYQTPGPFPSLGKACFKLIPEPATPVTLFLILGFARRR